jgi:hypothetical protein
MIINDNGVQREMTAAEEEAMQAVQEKLMIEAKAKETEAQVKAAAKAALFERLGITADEAALLLG